MERKIKEKRTSKKIKYNIKGITMVALVVTIIVLLILAGIAINLGVGKNGIIKRAMKSREESENAKQIENATLKTYENDIDKYALTSTDNNNEKDKEQDNENININVNFMDALRFLANNTTNSNYEEELNKIVNSKETMNEICSSANLFTVCINSKAMMKKMCESTIAKNAMYDNAEVTESILAGSEKALETIKESSSYEVVSIAMTSAFSTLYQGKAFVLGTSQHWHNGALATTMTHGNYIIGSSTLTYGAGGAGYATTGLGIKVNKFASSVQQKNSYGNSSSKFYSAILKIDE